jgi:hypothetical protein
MRLGISPIVLVFAFAAAFPATAQTSRRDGIADLLSKVDKTRTRVAENPANPEATEPPTATSKEASATEQSDPREGDPAYEQAKALMEAIDSVLKDAAENRSDARKLPSRDEFLVTPIWTETREDRESKIRGLLDSALGIVTDVSVVEVQKKIEGLRANIRSLEEQIVALKEKRITAPKDALLPGILTDTVASLDGKIEDLGKRIEGNRSDITKAKSEIAEALTKSGIQIGADQLDLLLDSVLSGELVRLVATFNAAKLIDGQLAQMMTAAGENINASRKYFAMHAALFAMLLHAQNLTIEKIDTGYMPKLDAILKDITAAKAKTVELMRAENRPDQRRALEANRESQLLAEEAAKGYRRYLQQQREQIAKARARAAHDLKIADNTYETVEASFQLRNLMRDSSASFEAIQRLEAPTFDQIFKNEELRREFENLTRKLDTPSS